MQCPFCLHADVKVVNKRNLPEVNAIRRRRECRACKKRFTTYERIELAGFTIVKKDGRRESYDRDKLTDRLLRACEKRPIAREHIDRLVNEVEAEIMTSEEREVSSSVVGNLVIEKLRALDKVAYIRFASVYREFADLGSFEAELTRLRESLEVQNKKQQN